MDTTNGLQSEMPGDDERAGSAASAEGPPNILLLMTDQQRWDSLSCYGGDVVQTPNLDHLASEGARFENCYCNAPICTPSRASILTGKEVPGHGVYRLHDLMPRAERLFPEVLQKQGYRTGLFGKLHVSGRVHEAENRHPHDGFDVYDWCIEGAIHLDSPLNGYARWLKTHHPAFFERLKNEGRGLLHIPREFHFTHWAAEASIDFIRRSVAEGKPFFCKTSIFDPHNPYEDYPIEYEGRVHENALSRRIEDSRRNIAPTLERERNGSYFGSFDEFSDADIRNMRRGYYASVALMDDEYGRIIDVLRELDVLDNTLVVFVSDHGDMLGDHDLMVKGAFFYDAGVRVPLILRWPAKIPRGSVPDTIVQPHQIAQTVLAAAGIEMPSREGATLFDALSQQNTSTAPNGTAVCLYRNAGIGEQGDYWDPPLHATMLRQGNYKLTVYHGDPGRGELYDLRSDPDELHNLWDDPERMKTRLELIEALVAWFHAHELEQCGSRGGDARPTAAQKIGNRGK